MTHFRSNWIMKKERNLMHLLQLNNQKAKKWKIRPGSYISRICSSDCTVLRFTNQSHDWFWAVMCFQLSVHTCQSLLLLSFLLFARRLLHDSWLYNLCESFLNAVWDEIEFLRSTVGLCITMTAHLKSREWGGLFWKRCLVECELQKKDCCHL